jgi:Protein of unknown function (DUF3305)
VNTVVDSTVAVVAIPAKVIWAVDVAFRKRAVQSRWVDFQWEAASVELADGSPQVASQSAQIDENEGETLWRWRGFGVDLHPSEGEGYWLNLTSDVPCVFVMWRMEEGDETPRPVVITVSYNEAGRMLDAGDRVDRVAMPEPMQAALAEYTMAHYKPEVRKKVKRNDPFKNRQSRQGGDRG